MQLSRTLRPSFNVQQQHRRALGVSRASPNETPTAAVKLQLAKHVDFGVGIAVVGSVQALGAWQSSQVVPLAWSEQDVWRGELSLPTGVDIEYKYVCTHSTEGEQPSEPSLKWQQGDNLTLNLPAGTTSATVVDSWEAGHTTIDLLPASTGTAAVPQALLQAVPQAMHQAVPQAAEVAKEASSMAEEIPAVVPVAVPIVLPVAEAVKEEATTTALPSEQATPTEVARPSVAVPAVAASPASNIVPKPAPKKADDPWAPKVVSGDVIKSTKATKAAKSGKAGKAGKAVSGETASREVSVPAAAAASNILPGPLSKAPAGKAVPAVKEETADAR